eukprot:g19604.t1
MLTSKRTTHRRCIVRTCPHPFYPWLWLGMAPTRTAWIEKRPKGPGGKISSSRGEINALPWLDAPRMESVGQARELLQRLQVLVSRPGGVWEITERGRRVSQLPILVTWLLIVICFVGYLWKSYGGLAASASSHHPALERIVHLLERHKADGDQAITSLTAPSTARVAAPLPPPVPVPPLPATKSVIRPWQQLKAWQLHVFGCFERTVRSKLRFTALWPFKAKSQFERLGLCAKKVLDFGSVHQVEYQWFVRWRPDFVVFDQVRHPSTLPSTCIGCRFRTVAGVKVTKNMMSWDPSSAIIKPKKPADEARRCADCDDQVFMIPKDFVQGALVNLANPGAVSSIYRYHLQLGKGEAPMTMAWENGVDLKHHLCGMEVPGALSKHSRSWKSWKMPAHASRPGLADPVLAPAPLRSCRCCCNSTPLRSCSSSRCDRTPHDALCHG